MFSLLAQTTKKLAGPDLYLPVEASTNAANIDLLMHFILAISVFFTLLILVGMVFLAVKYRHKHGQAAAPSAGHSTALELTWTIIPTVIVVVIFFFGFIGFRDMIVPPPNTYEIQAKGVMWNWQFTYPNGFTSPDLHVPAGVPVRVILTTDDVIHALYIPALRVQKMNTPGRYNRIWFEAKFVDEEAAKAPHEQPYTEQHEIFCNMYCGTSHSEMLSTLYVHRREDFDAWLAEASDIVKQISENKITPVAHGKAVHGARGCAQCHSLDGSANTGPTWKDLFGNQRKFADGSSAVADENYIRESILQPDAHIVQGFGSVMPSYRGSLKDADIDAVISYMKTISSHYSGADPNVAFLTKYKLKGGDGGGAATSGPTTGASGKTGGPTPQGSEPNIARGGAVPGATPSTTPPTPPAPKP